MKVIRTLMVSGAIAGLGLSSAAMAGEATRSASAMPQTEAVTDAPVRVATPAKKKKSHLSGAASYAVPVLAVAAVAGGIVAVATDDDDTPKSPG